MNTLSLTDNELLPFPDSSYRNLLDNAPVAIYTTDQQGYINYYNKAAVEIWGCEPEIGKNRWCGSWKIFQPDGITPLPLEECPMAIILKEQRKMPGSEIIIERPDGSRRNVLPYPELLYDHSGEMIGAVNTLVDVTERKASEKNLARFEAIIQSSEDAIIAKTLFGTVTSWNDAAERIFGYTEEEMIGQSIIKLIPTDRQKEESYILQRIRNGERVQTFETKRLTKNGEIIDVSLSISPIKDRNGYIIGASKIVRDITRQKELDKALQQSEERLKTITSASPAALWMTDRNRKNVFISDTWLKWTGKSFEEQIDRGWLSVLAEEDRERVIKEFFDCFEQQKYFATEFRVPAANGDLRWYMTEGRPFYDNNGNFEGYAGSVTDITDIKQLEQRKDDFIKMASHELKTPITSITGYVQLLQNIYEQQDEKTLQVSKEVIKSSLGTISRQVLRLTRLVSELLDLSRIESGRLDLKKTEFNLEELVEEAVQEARYTTTRHAIIFSSEYKGNLIGDRDRIGQVLANLLNNAIKYSTDSDKIEVWMEAVGENRVTISIKDYGIGIAKKDQSRIFERFYRAEGKSEQTYPGFGIGLFIANEIVQRHNGTITVKSQKNKGALFVLSLPNS